MKRVESSRVRALLAALVLSCSVDGAGALDLRGARESFVKLSQGFDAAPSPAPPEPGEPAPAGGPSEDGFRTSVREYRIGAPLVDIWEFYTLTPLPRLMPQGWAEPKLAPYRVLCPDRARSYPPGQAWPALQEGLRILGFLRWGPTRIPQNMDVTAVEPLRRIEFRYGDPAPAEGSQSISFEEQPWGAGVRVVHESRYRGKNPLYQAMYEPVHRKLLDYWHLSAKRYLEARAWAGSFCGAAPPLPASRRLQELHERVRRRVPGGGEVSAEGLRQALCLFSARRLGLASSVPGDEESLAGAIGELAVALARDRERALRLLRGQVEADGAAKDAALRACRP